MMNKLLITFFLLSTITISCTSKDKKAPIAESSKSNPSTGTCELFWANVAPERLEKVSLLNELINGDNQLQGDNKKLLHNLIDYFEKDYNENELDLMINRPLFPIYRLKRNQLGITFPASPEEIDGRLENMHKEHDVLVNNFAYQSIDSVGKLVAFPEEFSTLFNDAPPTFYWYSLSKKSKSRLTHLAYYDDECLSYYHYGFTENKTNNIEDSILFGSNLSLDLAYGQFPEIDKAFKKQFANNCTDCPTNYPDQKTFARLIGTTNIYFTYADKFPINTQFAAPSRSLVMMKKNGQVITLWTSEFDLTGCGCL